MAAGHGLKPASPAAPRRQLWARSPAASRRRLGGLDPFEVSLLAVFALLSLWTLGLDVAQVLLHGRIWTGTDAVYEEDGMQSLMWIRGIMEHGASPDLWVLRPTAPDFFQPLLAICAGLAALGLPPYVALLLWKPVAVLAVFLAARAYLHRVVVGRWARRAALALALFYAWGRVIGDAWIVWWTWGYPFALISLACATVALIAYARARERGRISGWACALAALASWLHPWQGETLCAIVIGCELIELLRRRRLALRGAAATLACALLPLLYFVALVAFDPVWQREREAALSGYPLSHVASVLGPIAAVALLGYRLPPRDFLGLSLRVWPLASAAVFAISDSQGSGPTHALLGCTIPLAALAVEGIRTLPWDRFARRPAVRAAGTSTEPDRALAAPAARASRPPLQRLGAVAAVAALAAFTIPGSVWMLENARSAIRPKRGNANFIEPSENDALRWLARSPLPGGVLTRFYLGMVVPAQTGRRAYVGDCFWSEPRCGYRSRTSEQLLKGELDPAAARSFVRSTGARFVLADCESSPLAATLAPLTQEVVRFSCATVYVLRPQLSASG